jgi:hypothetical protein
MTTEGLRILISGLAHDASRLDKTLDHRVLWLEKTDSDNNAIAKLAWTIEDLADKVMAKCCAVKEAVIEMRGEL